MSEITNSKKWPSTPESVALLKKMMKEAHEDMKEFRKQIRVDPAALHRPVGDITRIMEEAGRDRLMKDW